MKKILKFAALPVTGVAMAVFVLGATPAYAAAASVSVSPSSGVTIGQTVTVTGTGYPAGAIFLVECKTNAADGSGCNKTAIGQATADASGKFSGTFKVNSQCPATGTCYILATTATQKPVAYGSFTLGAGGGGSSSPAPTSSSTATGGTAPTGVNAGSGGNAGSESVPESVLALAALGLLGLGLGVGGVRRYARH